MEKKSKKQDKTDDPNFIGEGTYGSVFIEKDMAVKKFWELPTLVQEYCALIKLEESENVVKAKKLDIENLSIGMELYEMDFHEWIKNNPNEEKKFLKLFRSFLKGLVYLHDQNLVHADIKPGNILVNLKGKKCVVGDCGFVSLEPNEKCKLTATKYRDPNPLRRKSHDMYSCGIILTEYFGGPLKFNTISELIKLAEKIQNYKHKKLILNEIEKCKREKRNPHKALLKLSKKMCSHNCSDCPKDIVAKMIISCKKMEYEYIYRIANKIQNKKISQIAINLVQYKHQKRINSRKLYFELYGERLPSHKLQIHNYPIDLDPYKVLFEKQFKNSLFMLINHPQKYIIESKENEFKNIKSFVSDKKNLLDFITNKTLDKALYAFAKNTDFFEETNLNKFLLISVYIASCIYNRRIIGNYLHTIILSNYSNEKDFFNDLRNLMTNKHFVLSLYE